ncbi:MULTISPECIES: DUF309 domain-containing protein [Bacillus]|uniref:DUF309 domain-containing protein n=1 Tax=Bacillus TaxID=1386 RepID=UPI000BB7D7B4|nr:MULTISPECIES: DUF309 domain-containing protein [Bacillus]
MYPKPYLDYLYYFHCARDYFECHEVLEEYWKEKPAEEREIHWVGFIQIAVGLYHHRRGNKKGALRMLQNALTILSNQNSVVESLGLDSLKLKKTLEAYIVKVENDEPYESLNLPVKNTSLISLCERKKEVPWGTKSDLTNLYLINKHTLRDRSEVILERETRLKRKKNSTD